MDDSEQLCIINFLIVAFVIFLIIREVNELRPPAEPPATTKDCPHCASKIPVEARKCPQCTSELAAA